MNIQSPPPFDHEAEARTLAFVGALIVGLGLFFLGSTLALAICLASGAN